MLKNRWLFCWLLFVATALSFLDRQVLSVLAPTITKEFSLSNGTYSRVVFAFQASYTAMFAVGGRLADLLGTRLAMGAFLAVWSLASAAHSLTRGPWGLGLSRFALGLGEGGCFPAATKGAAEWFGPDQRALAVGIATGGSALGAVIAPPLTALMAVRLGWRGTFVGTGLLGFAWVSAWLVATRKGIGDERVALSAAVPVREWLMRPQVRWILFGRFLFDPVFYFYMFWIPQYLSRER